jgi:hypothetical protein
MISENMMCGCRAHSTTIANLVGCGGCNERRTKVGVGRHSFDPLGVTAAVEGVLYGVASMKIDAL